MKTIKPLIILLLASFKALFIFSQTNAVLNYLPEEAKMIIKVNPRALGQKMKWDEFAKSKIFDDIIKDASEEGKAFLKSPRETGVDLSQGIYVVIPAGKSNKKPEPILYGVIKDTSAFAAMIRKFAVEAQTVKLGSGKLLINKKTGVAWNKEVFIIATDDSKAIPVYPAAKSKASDEQAKRKEFTEKCKALLTVRKVPFSNEHFISLLKQEGDVHLWINNTVQSQEQKKVKTPQFVDMLNKNIMKSGNYTAGVVTFENGRIAMQMQRYISPSLDSLYRKYPAKTINTDLTGKLPGGQLIMLYSFSFSPEMIREIFTKAGADKFIDSVSKKKIKMDDIVSAVTGDAAMAVMKVYEFTEEDSVTQAMNGIQVFLTGGIKDKEKFHQLSAILQMERNDTSKTQAAKKMKPVVFEKDSVFVVSLSKIAAQKFLESQPTNEQINKLTASYKNYPSAFILDLKTIFGFAMQSMSKNKSEEEIRQMSEALNMFDKLISYGGAYNNGALLSTVELSLSNKDENSLKQFIDLVQVLYLMGNKKSSNLQKVSPDVEKKQ